MEGSKSKQHHRGSISIFDKRLTIEDRVLNCVWWDWKKRVHSGRLFFFFFKGLCEFWIWLPFLLCLGCYLAIKELRAKCATLLLKKWARISSIVFCVLTSLQHYSILFFSRLFFLCPNFLLILYLLLWFYELPQFLIGKSGFGAINRKSEITVGLGKFWVWLYSFSLKTLA